MVDDTLTRRVRTAPALLAAAVVGLQIAYPLAGGAARDRLTVLIVAGLAATCLLHAALTRGLPTAVALLLVTAAPGYAVEVLGVHTGFPFGRYTYGPGLGPKPFGAPLIVALAWTMLGWPAAIAARRLVRSPAARIAVGAWALAAADLFLDPQQVRAGYWTWRFPVPHLPGVPDVPLTNYAGWLLVALLMSAALQAIVGDDDGADTVMIAMYLWLYIGWIVALVAFLHLAAAAGWGAVGMGAVAVPLAVNSWRRR